MFGHGKKLIKAGLTFLTLSQIPLLLLGLIAMLGIEISFVDLPEIRFSVQGAILFGLTIVSIVIISIASAKNDKYGKAKGSIYAPFGMVFLALLVTKAAKIYDVIIRNEGTFASLFKNNFFLSSFIAAIISLLFFVALLVAKLIKSRTMMRIVYFISHFAILFMMFMQVSNVVLFLLFGFKPIVLPIVFMVSAGLELLALLFIFFASLALGYSSGIKQADEGDDKSKELDNKKQPESEPQTEPKESNDDKSEEGVTPTATKFTCPNCCASFDGQPDECPFCGSKFNWKK